MKHFDLINEYYRVSLDYENADEEGKAILQPTLDDFANQLGRNVEFFDELIHGYNIRKGKLEGWKKQIKAELDSVSNKLKALDTAKKRLEGLMMETIEQLGKKNKTGNPQLKTDISSFTIVTRRKPVIVDENVISDDFKIYKEEINKKLISEFIKNTHSVPNGVELEPYKLLIRR